MNTSYVHHWLEIQINIFSDKYLSFFGGKYFTDFILLIQMFVSGELSFLVVVVFVSFETGED